MKYIRVFLFYSLILFSHTAFGQYEGAVIKGNVTNSHSGDPVIEASVRLLDSHRTTSSDANGDYIFAGLSPGTYVMEAHYISLKQYIDTVVINEPNQIIGHNIVLQSYMVDLEDITNPQLEAYHTRLQQINEKMPVMRIHIDSLREYAHRLTAFLSITNTINDSFYIFKSYPCFNKMIPEVSDSAGDKVKANLIMIDCVGEKTCPDENDLILISPGGTVTYPAELFFYNFERLPKGRYSIRMKYEFKKPEEINTLFCWDDSAIDALITGLRGTYISDNTISFINK